MKHPGIRLRMKNGDRELIDATSDLLYYATHYSGGPISQVFVGHNGELLVVEISPERQGAAWRTPPQLFREITRTVLAWRDTGWGDAPRRPKGEVPPL